MSVVEQRLTAEQAAAHLLERARRTCDLAPVRGKVIWSLQDVTAVRVLTGRDEEEEE